MIYCIEKNIKGFHNLQKSNIIITPTFIAYGWDTTISDFNIRIMIDLNIYKKQINNIIVNEAYDYIIYCLRKEKLKNILNENY